MPGYFGLVSTSTAGGGEQCPQCGESDLRPYGNGSKWACPRCYFIVPCCEGGELAPSGACVPAAGTALVAAARAEMARLAVDQQDAEGWRRAHEGHRRSFSPGELASGVLRCFSTNAVGAAALLHLTPDGECDQHANTPRCHREPT